MPTRLRSDRIEGTGGLLVVHGGAWDIPDSALEEHRAGLRSVVESTPSILQEVGQAVDGATEAVAALEAHEAFNAGYGAMLNQDGEAELDAGVMDGDSLEFGAVAATRHVARPVRVARRLLDEGEGRVRMLVGEGAERFAEAEGMALVPNEALVCPREQARHERVRAQVEPDHPSTSFLPGASPLGGADTVGSVVRDPAGRLAAATSTGGTPFKPPGRVGDSPLPGAGFYADEHVAVSATGWGEAIAMVGLARDVRERVVGGAPAEGAARRALRRMQDRVESPDGEGATGGCIVVTPEDAAYAFTTPRMARGWCTGGEAHWTV
ncbi:MAG: isoaspartyl peptidase/L-asparaginase family protein [Salinibacter sp.]|uniref:isoaspartyl peptidase/L-asparaginase family protein n=1 Tax=Salinibacter sp. TaxID=2065818 RepID=UPI0035D406C7